MTAKELQLDYFRFYDVANQSADFVVGLQGQFDKRPEKNQLTHLNHFANPASKNGEPIYDKNAHFDWYDLYDPSPDPTREVAYKNQFGESKLYTGRASALLTPAQKHEAGSRFPDKLDHYKVYQVLQGEALETAILLEDQFGADEVRIYHPIFFAVPVSKWWEGEESRVQNEKAHLVIYRVFPGAAEKTVKVTDQFGRRDVQVFRSVLLGAPSVKLGWQEV